MEYEQFDRRLARECAKAFSQSTGLGCTLSDKTGRAFDEYGYGCESCGMCAAAGASHDRCVQAHIYGMTEAERFGGTQVDIRRGLCLPDHVRADESVHLQKQPCALQIVCDVHAVIG